MADQPGKGALARRGHQRGALSLRNGVWTVRIRLAPDVADGRRATRRLRVGPRSKLRTRRAARLEADRLLERMRLVAPVTGKTATFATFARGFLETHLVHYAPSVQASYRSIVNHHLVPHLGGYRLDEIAGPVPAGLVTALARAGLARPSIRAVMGVLSRMLHLAAQQGFAAAALNRSSYRLPPKPPAPNRRCFTAAESAAIIEAADYPWRAFFALMAYAGLRVSEALGLEWRHVDLVRGQLHIRQAAVMGQLKTVKSANSAADLPMAPQLLEVLRDYRNRTATPAGLLFPSPQGGPYWSGPLQRTRLVPILKRLGIPHGGLHAFRHGAATNLFAAGASAPTVRGMLRHGDIKTTLGYVHVTSADMRAAADAAAALIHPTTPTPHMRDRATPCDHGAE